MSSELQTFSLGDFVTQAGESFPSGAQLSYKTWGEPSRPVIVYCTAFIGLIEDSEWLISEKREGLNPSNYFIIIPALFGNSQSSSPSHFGGKFPKTTVYDNVRAQHLLLQHLGISKVLAVVGWSMGAAQAFQWATSYPTMMSMIVPFCGAARTSLHNITFLRSLVLALELDPKYQQGAYHPENQPQEGKKVFAAIVASWAMSQTFYRRELFKDYGFASLDDYLTGHWEKFFSQKDANNLLYMLQTWISADITRTPGHSWTHNLPCRSPDALYYQALAGIQARCLIMPGSSDLYFPPEDSQIEVAHIPKAMLSVISSDYGHQAGSPLNPDDVRFLDKCMGTFFKI